MSFCTEAQFEQRYDTRLIAQYSNDANSTTKDSAVVQAALDDADGDVKSAVLRGGIYVASDLTTLDTNDEKLLIRLCATLAMKHLVGRRGRGARALKDDFDWAQETLKLLRDGARVFDVATPLAADEPEVITLTVSEKENLDTMTNTTFFGGVAKTKSIAG